MISTFPLNAIHGVLDETATRRKLTTPYPYSTTARLKLFFYTSDMSLNNFFSWDLAHLTIQLPLLGPEASMSLKHPFPYVYPRKV